MCEEGGVCGEVEELNGIHLSDHPASTAFWQLAGRKNLPVSVVIELIGGSNLLTYKVGYKNINK